MAATAAFADGPFSVKRKGRFTFVHRSSGLPGTTNYEGGWQPSRDALVRAPGDLWFDKAAVDSLEARVRAHFDDHDELDTPTYKAIIGTTRRSAMPLMEHFDDRHLTRRRGNVRVPFKS